MNLSSPITRLRIISIIDALSFLYLLYCSLYLKRWLGDDEAIRIPGMVHGFLFCLFCIALYQAMEHKKWSFKTAILVFLTCLVPFLPFWLETWLKKQED
ncbi:MAG: DUF3817 domain-containing protein [Akkermansiaceae bacterium]